MAGHFDRYWEMHEGGPYDTPEETNKIFKCKDCGAETFHAKGFDGEPDTGKCHAGCPSRASDWRPGRVSNAYRRQIGQVAFAKETPLADKGRAVGDDVKAIRVYKSEFDRIFPNAGGVRI